MTPAVDLRAAFSIHQHEAVSPWIYDEKRNEFMKTATADDVNQMRKQSRKLTGNEDEEDILKKECYEGTPVEMKKLRKPCRLPWGDRRQELVFICCNLDHAKIQEILDSCLLTDQEFAHGVDVWKAVGGDSFLNGMGV